MTEEEALKRWCPFSSTTERFGNGATSQARNRVFIEGGGPIMRPLAGATCMGSLCMAWRWKPVANPDWRDDTSMITVSPRRNPYAEPPASIPSTTDGYCGLAGRP